jgi:DHA3 family macrolide efflux protein-like MFS transporter
MQAISYNTQKWKPFFFTIWSGQALSILGSMIVNFALIWYMTETTGSAVILTTSTIINLVPMIFLGPILGTLVDRWKRRSIIIIADGLIVIATIILALLFWTGSMQIWHIYILLLIRSLFGGLHYMAMQSSTALMVPEKHLSRVAGMNQTLTGSVSIAGPLIGAFLLGIMPLYNILLIDILTAITAIVPLLFIVIPEPERDKDSGKSVVNFKTIRTDLVEGFQYVRAWPGLFGLLILSTLINFVLRPVFSLVPLLITRHYGGGAIEFGWVDAAFGAGAILGGLLLGVWGGFKKRMVSVVVGGTFGGIGILFTAIGPSDALWMALFGFGLFGFTMAFVDGPLMAILQAKVAPDMQGRVFSLLMSLTRIAAPIGLLAAGPISDLIDIRIWFLFGGAMVAILSLAALFVPTILNIEQNSNHIKQPVSQSQTP